MNTNNQPTHTNQNNNFNEQESEIRRHWIEQIVKAVFSRQGKELRPEKVAEYAALWLPTFAPVATIDLEAVLILGQEKRARTKDEFMMFWDMKCDAEEAERAAQNRQAEYSREQARVASSQHAQRDAVFAKWRGEVAI